MKYYIISFLIAVGYLSYSIAQDESTEVATIREIVFMRTEGLILIEQIRDSSEDEETLRICSLISGYYQETQAAALELCQQKKLGLAEEQFAVIFNDIKEQLDTVQQLEDNHHLLMCEEHISGSIALYSKIVRDNEWKNVSYFSFVALPQLFNIKKEIQRVREFW